MDSTRSKRTHRQGYPFGLGRQWLCDCEAESVTHLGAMSASGPACVKTCPSRECAELFSLFSSFDGDRQGGSFVIERNRDKLSTRKFDVGVFTQAGSLADLDRRTLNVRFTLNSGHLPARLSCPFCANRRHHSITSSARA